MAESPIFNWIEEVYKIAVFCGRGGAFLSLLIFFQPTRLMNYYGYRLKPNCMSCAKEALKKAIPVPRGGSSLSYIINSYGQKQLLIFISLHIIIV